MKAVNIPAELSEYHSVIRLPVQWGDQDAFGHVNNTVYFRWFESARIAYFQHTGIEGPLAAMQSSLHRHSVNSSQLDFNPQYCTVHS